MAANEDRYDEDGIPVFLINGFLEAGKTQFLSFTMAQEYFKTEGKTLLIVCEEGDTEYDKDLLSSNNTTLIQVETEEDITPDRLHEWALMYLPERVIIEWNGMWIQSDLKLPDDMFINQTITIIDTSTFDLYLKNLKPMLGPMLSQSEMVICNRADGISEDVLGKYYISIKAMASGAEIIFEGKDGEIRGDFNIELPYDLKADSITVANEDYGIFYVDSMDRSQKYDGKTVTLTGQILRPNGIPDDTLVIGRRVMTCCEADTQFLGLMCHYKNAASYNNRDWVKMTAKIAAEDCKEYNGMGPVLYVQDIALTGPVNEIVQF